MHAPKRPSVTYDQLSADNRAVVDEMLDGLVQHMHSDPKFMLRLNTVPSYGDSRKHLIGLMEAGLIKMVLIGEDQLGWGVWNENIGQYMLLMGDA